VSHDISMVYQVADEIAMMKDGKIIFQGPLHEFQESKNPMCKIFTSVKLF